MKDYLFCVLFWGIFTIFLSVLGHVITAGKKSSSYNLVCGYLVYSFLVAVGGIVVQVFNLPWLIFAAYMGIVWAGLICMIICVLKRNRTTLLSFDMHKYLKENWVVYVVCLAMIGLMFFYYGSFWLGNHLDDGYYITKIATLPYSQTGGNMNYSVGVVNEGFNTYIVNTWEIEASVYVKMLGVNPAVYLRLFQSAFNYFLFLNVVKTFVEIVFDSFNIKNKEIVAQYPVVVTILFNIYYLALNDTYFFRLRDMFHFNTGMFLGVSITKTLGILLLLLFFIDKQKITIKMIVGVMAISIVLMSKSTIALPVIGIIVIVSLLVWLFFDYGKKGKIVSSAAVMLLVGIAFILPNKEGIEGVVYSDFKAAICSPVIMICGIIFVCSFGFKNQIVNKINAIIVLSTVFMLTPQLNDIFEAFSIYTFVGGRALTTMLYTFVIINSGYLFMLLKKIRFKELAIRGVYVILAVTLIAAGIFGYKRYGGEVLPDSERKEAELRFSLSVIKHNPYFIPDSTIALGEELNRLSNEADEQLYVVTPKMVIMDGAIHSLAVILRTYAPDIVVTSAVERFPINDGSALAEYKQAYYDAFAAQPSANTAEDFAKEIETIDVNCIVVQNPDCEKWLEQMGYEYYSMVEEGGYYIYTK